MSLREAITFSQANPDSEYANELRKRIESGSMDQQAAIEGVSLPGRPKAAIQEAEGPGVIDRLGSAASGSIGIFKSGAEKAMSGLTDIGQAFTSKSPVEQFTPEGEMFETREDLPGGRTASSRARQFFRGISRLGSGSLTAAAGATPIGAGIAAGAGFIEPEIGQAIQSASKTDFGKAAIEEWQTLSPSAQEGIINIVESLPTATQSGAKALKGQLATTGRIASKVGKKAIEGAGKAGALTKSVAEEGLAKATSLSPETIKTIVEETPDFIKAQKNVISRESLADGLKTSFDDAVRDVSETGAQYNKIRQAKEVIQTPIKQIDDLMSKADIKVGKGGRLDFSDSAIGSIANRNAIQTAYKEIVRNAKMTGGKVLNLRGRVDDLINFESGTTGRAQAIVKQMRGMVDDVAKNKIPGLKELDSKFSKIKGELKQFKKDFFNKDGSLKDTAMSKVANLTKKGREILLGRLEPKMPGVTRQIKALTALEDVTDSLGNKVGTYFRTGVAGAGAASGNIPVIVASVLTSPKVAAEVLKAYAKVSKVPRSMLGKIMKNIQEGIKLSEQEATVFTDALKNITPKQAAIRAIPAVAESIPTKNTLVNKDKIDTMTEEELDIFINKMTK
jgi:hypothetical protein